MGLIDERISVDQKYVTAACIKGTELWCRWSLIIWLQEKYRRILQNYPSLDINDIRAAIAYGALLSKERTIVLP